MSNVEQFIESDQSSYAGVANAVGQYAMDPTMCRQATLYRRTANMNRAPQAYYDFLSLQEAIKRINERALTQQLEIAHAKNLENEQFNRNGVSFTALNLMLGMGTLYAARGQNGVEALGLAQQLMQPHIDEAA